MKERLIIKLNRRYKLKILQIYAPTSAYNNGKVEFHEDVEIEMKKNNT